MNDDRLLRELESWLVEADPEPPDARTSVRQAMASVSPVRQRGRWWPLTILERSAGRPTADQTTEFQPSRLPATNGHTGTVTRSTQTMLGPAKAITAGALIFALGGVMLIAQPFDRQEGTVPGATTEAIRPGLATNNGLIAFAADASAGDALTDPVEYAAVETRPERMDIYVTSPGEPTRRLIATDAHERCPAFSPDGQYLAYLELAQRVPSAAPSIVVAQVDAAGTRSAPELRVPLPAAEVYGVKLSIGSPCPQWSPDGRQIAYLALPQRELRVSTLDGQERVLDSVTPSLAEGPFVVAPFAWSPKGDAIAYTTSDGVWVGSLDGSAPTLVWRTDGRPVSVSWSPGAELAVTVLTELALEGGGIRDVRTVHVVDVDTGREHSVGTIHVYDYGAVWSPDGSRLAFVDENGNVRSIDPSDGSMTTLSPRYADGAEMHFWDVAWSPDGERLLAMARSDSLRAPANSADGPSEIGFALVSLSTDGASADVLTPWTWALDWINLQEVSWQPITN